ncbi:MAG: nitroreductase family protein [Ardenticatenaceae bacterium]
MNINKLIEERFGKSTNLGNSVVPNKTLSDILTRSSCRSYKNEPIPSDLLQTLFATAFSAPSKSDLQQACVIHVKNKNKQARIANSFLKINWIADAPVFLVWCGDGRRIRRLSQWRGHKFANDHLDAFMNAAVDAGIAMQTFIIAAESVGLGCCPVSEIRNHIHSLSEELQLPQWVFPVAGLCVGWPASQSAISMRLPMDVTVMVDQYDDSKLIEQVEDYDQRRESVEQTPPDKQRLIDKFGVSSNYGWSENRSRQYSQAARDDFGKYIRDQGFNLT